MWLSACTQLGSVHSAVVEIVAGYAVVTVGCAVVTVGLVVGAVGLVVVAAVDVGS